MLVQEILILWLLKGRGAPYSCGGGRRLKKIAYGWSDRGVTKIARIILKRFANKAEWEKYWQEKSTKKNSVVILLRNLKGSCKIFHMNFPNIIASRGIFELVAVDNKFTKLPPMGT